MQLPNKASDGLHVRRAMRSVAPGTTSTHTQVTNLHVFDTQKVRGAHTQPSKEVRE